MAYLSLSAIHSGPVKVRVADGNNVAISFDWHSYISLSRDEAQQLIDSLTALLAETAVEEVAA